MNQSQTGSAATRYQFTICLVIFGGYILVFFHRLCPAVIALDMQVAFGLSGTLLGLLGSFYFYPYAIMQLPTGLLADSWGPRKTVSSFFLLAAAGSILMGIAQNVSMAIFGRFLVGIGISTLFVCNFKLLAEWFPPKRFVIMGGVFMAMGGVGALSSAAPLAWMSNRLGWRMTLVAVGLVTLLMAILIYVFVRNRPTDVGLPPFVSDQDRQKGEGLKLLEGPKMILSSGGFWALAVWNFFSARDILCLGRPLGWALSYARLRDEQDSHRRCVIHVCNSIDHRKSLPELDGQSSWKKNRLRHGEPAFDCG